MSHRVSNGTRVNQWGHPIDSGATVVRKDKSVRSAGKRPSHKEANGYDAPKLANPGNFIDCTPPPSESSDVVEVIVGGGVMGNRLCHENEAPFPEKLAEFFIRSFCPPGGTVLDPFCGSGTTLAMAKQNGRGGVGIDLRQSQIDLTKRRLEETAGDLA